MNENYSSAVYETHSVFDRISGLQLQFHVRKMFILIYISNP